MSGCTVTLSRRLVPLRTLFSPTASANSEPGVFAPLRETLLLFGDHYRNLADLTSYRQARKRLGALCGDPDAWRTKQFCTQREVLKRPYHAESASESWKVELCRVLWKNSR
jgi:glucan phosphorylase